MEFPHELISKRHGDQERVFTRVGGEFNDGSTWYTAIGDYRWWSADIRVFPNGDVKTLDINGHFYDSGKMVGNEIHE